MNEPPRSPTRWAWLCCVLVWVVAWPAAAQLELDITEDTFAREIAPARTFVLEQEVTQLQAEGLGKGATTQNTLVIGPDGVIDNELRFKDEFVRHKILDLIGDLYLMSCRLNGTVMATKSGHALNVRLAKLILENTARELDEPFMARQRELLHALE